jgi:membrane-associated phospholipid phosphatase
MKSEGLKHITRKNLPFFIGFLIYAVAGLLLNILYSQQQLFFFVNRNNTPVYDLIMPSLTFVGDGIIFIAVIILLAFKKIRFGLMALAAFLLESALVQTCKLLIFTDHPRPWKRWGKDFDIYLIDGFTPYSSNSFPSGHTASAFCMFTILALIISPKKTGPLFLLMAILVSYSRIYLAQHYFIDTYVGACIGVFSAVVMYVYFYSPRRKFNQETGLLDRSLLNYKK